MAKDPKTNVPNPRIPVVCSCGHDKTQHSRVGCIWQELRGGKWWQCPCSTTYNQL